MGTAETNKILTALNTDVMEFSKSEFIRFQSSSFTFKLMVKKYKIICNNSAKF